MNERTQITDGYFTRWQTSIYCIERRTNTNEIVHQAVDVFGLFDFVVVMHQLRCSFRMQIQQKIQGLF